MSNIAIDHPVLGKKTEYVNQYDPQLLFPIPRKKNRDAIGVTQTLPFFGFDIWNHYEVSWLNQKGKPIVAVAVITIKCDSINIIESKSMKLYFNSLNNTMFHDIDEVTKVIEKDLKERLETDFIHVKLIPVSLFNKEEIYSAFQGICIDQLDIPCSTYHANPAFLQTENEVITETLCSDLLKSNCLVTNQPDWCSVQITYTGKKINHESLLRYIVSFRNDNEFHEQCVEKIFMQINTYCKPSELIVYGRSTRRGGLDINSYRSSQPVEWSRIPNMRLCRQ